MYTFRRMGIIHTKIHKTDDSKIEYTRYNPTDDNSYVSVFVAERPTSYNEQTKLIYGHGKCDQAVSFVSSLVLTP